MNTYDKEAKQRYGDTAAYGEYEKKTAGYTKEKWQSAGDAMNKVLGSFADCMKSGLSPDSSEAASLVKALQDCITENFYTCTDEILAGLSETYVCDERFKKNIDKHGEGCAEFVSAAIKEALKTEGQREI